MFEQEIAQKLKIDGVEQSEIAALLEVPKDASMGDLALPCFRLSKLLKKSPAQIANELAPLFDGCAFLESAQTAGGYLNFKFNREEVAKNSSRRTPKAKSSKLKRGRGQNHLHRLFFNQHSKTFPYRALVDDGHRRRAVPHFPKVGL